MQIDGNKILLVGNRGHKNMGDEIILVGNIQLLLKEGKKLYIACSNKKWLKNFHKQFFLGDEEINEDLGDGGNKRMKDDKDKINVVIPVEEPESSKLKNKNRKIPSLTRDDIQLDRLSKSFLNFSQSLSENEQGFYNSQTGEQIITYVYELPKGFRSFIRLLKNIKDLKKMFRVDSVLVGGGEILTEETAYSYWYWFMSVWILLPFKKLYLSGGIQVPKKIGNRLLFKILTKKAENIYVRDYELVENGKLKVEFFPDTSFFTLLNNANYKLDLKNYKWILQKDIIKDKIIIININKKAEHFYNDIYNIVEKYYREHYTIYFAWICKSPADDDIVYYHKLKKDFPGIKLLDWERFDLFLDTINRAEKVYTTRLHLFLVSYYLGLDVVPFVYQKKVEKMKEVLNVKNSQ